MKHFLYLAFFVFAFASCKKELTAEEILQHAIEAHGGDNVYNSNVSFDFRDKHYQANYQDGSYLLLREFSDSLNNRIKDVLTNNGFERTINDSLVSLTDEWVTKYSNSVNSVIYFFRLPFNLKDPAVHLSYLGESQIEGKNYYKLKVRFSEDGGGEDFTDQFVYWFNTETFTLDYLAYEYATNGGGKRFRKAFNQRKVNGWLISDYHNYEPQDIKVEIEHYDNYFNEDGLKKLSEIVNENVQVSYN